MFSCEPFLLLVMIVFLLCLVMLWSIQLFYTVILYSINAVLIIVPQDSITRGWAVQRIGGYILRAEPSE